MTRKTNRRLALLRENKAEAEADLRAIRRYRGEEPRAAAEAVAREIKAIQAEIERLESEANPTPSGNPAAITLGQALVALGLTGIGVVTVVAGVRQGRA
jgi:acetylornithine deacetylase/succinyl-diaminopimelate desuccinylase-like protein